MPAIIVVLVLIVPLVILISWTGDQFNGNDHTAPSGNFVHRPEGQCREVDWEIAACPVTDIWCLESAPVVASGRTKIFAPGSRDLRGASSPQILVRGWVPDGTIFIMWLHDLSGARLPISGCVLGGRTGNDALLDLLVCGDRLEFQLWASDNSVVSPSESLESLFAGLARVHQES